MLPEDRKLVFVQLGNVGLSDIDHTPRGFFQSGELVEQGRFAGTGGPDNADNLPL